MGRTARALLLVASVAVLAVVGLVGWRLLGPEPTVAPDTPLAEQCGDVPEGAERITLTGDGGTVLGGVLVGPRDARVGVVLRQGASQTICEWLPWASDVSDQTGARVLLFDRRGRGSSPAERDLTAEPADTVAAVSRLREEGLDEVALVASSMGNSVMFSALPMLPEQPCAVVSISPVLTSSDDHGVVDGSRLEALPPNLWVTWEEQNAAIAGQAGRIGDAAGAQGLGRPHELPVATSHHSRQLVLNHAEVRDFLVEAIGSCGRHPA